MKIQADKKITWTDALLFMSHGGICMCNHNGSHYFMKCDADDNFRLIDPVGFTFLNQWLDKDDILQGEWYVARFAI